MPEDHFGEDVADGYDAGLGELGDPSAVEPVVEFLSGLAGAGPALELGIGTGRIALPLQARGVAVQGIDLSEAMLARLAAKPGGAQIPVALGDFATTVVEGSFRLVYLVFNTIMNLTTQDAQIACFENVGRHLVPGGRFVIEVMVPDLRRLPPGATTVPFDLSAEHLGFDEYDVAAQGLISHHNFVDERGVRTLAVPFRYVWPAELDLMARIAGMALEARYANWQRDPFTSESRFHISVWTRLG